jgi:hypothetical protein
LSLASKPGLGRLLPARLSLVFIVVLYGNLGASRIKKDGLKNLKFLVTGH